MPVIQRLNENYVLGNARADDFASARVEVGEGSSPKKWQAICKIITQQASNQVLCQIPVAKLRKTKQWTIRLQVQHKNGRQAENRFLLTMG